jgi:serine/threonine protein kinase
MIAGTPSYVAPEQAQGEHLDARADQFSLAALAYLLLAGRPAYSHSTLSAAAAPPPPPSLSSQERPFPQQVDDVVRRGLAVDRDDRYPDVPSFVEALRESLGTSGVGALPTRWLPVDPELTQPGNRPSLVPTPEELPDPEPPRVARPPRWPAAALALVLLVAGGLGGFALWRAGNGTKTFRDNDGNLRVTVPTSWAREVSLSEWKPPEESFSEPALSVGDGPDWRTDGQGVFVGVLSRGKLPTSLPQHPGCLSPGRTTSRDTGDPTIVATSRGCSGGSVIIERAELVSAKTLLWVQVRSDDLSTARQVLDSVRTYGLG